MATVDERALAGAGQDRARASAERSGMVVPRVFSTEGVSPYDQVDWDLRTAEIKDERGQVIFQQIDCEVPKGWSQLATNVVASKYFYGEINTPERETSVRQLVDRVTRTIADWGREDGYFASDEDAERFYDELTALCLNQYGSFNSPVWFNVGPVPPLRARGRGEQLAVGRGDPVGRQGDERLPVSAGLGLLHPERLRRHAGHHAPGHVRGDAVQVRLGDRHRPLDAALEQGEALRRRPSVRARSASCGSTTRSPASSSRAARPAAPPRCRRSRSGTPTSSSSSSARPKEEKKAQTLIAPATRPTSTAKPTAR